jgi:hypothetical protein
MKLSEKFGKALASYLAKPIFCPHTLIWDDFESKITQLMENKK